MSDAQCIWDARAMLGEGPVWHEDEGALYWVDIKSSRLYRIDDTRGDKTFWDLKEPLCCFAPRAGKGFIGAYQSRLAFLDHEGHLVEDLGQPEAHLPTNRFNDGKVGPDGGFWFGSMDNQETAPTGSLYRFAPGGGLTHHAADTVVTNGPAFSPDGGTMYFNHSGERRVFALDLAADGTLSNKRLHIQLGEADGYPDGMTSDAQGNLWLATFAGWGVKQFDPSGRRIGEIRLPVANVTSCAFGGPDYETLYITTARWMLPPEALAEQPLAGGLFRVKPGVRGMAPFRFEG